MRFDIKTETKKPINIHLPFPPKEINHEREIDRLLNHLVFEFAGKKYRCTIPERAPLGGTLDPKQTDERATTRVGTN